MKLRTSRLWTQLRATQPIFNVVALDGSLKFDDNSILSITMTRGAAGTTSGITPSSAEVEVADAWPAAGFDSPLRVDLTGYGAALIGVPLASTQNRWHGRIAAQRVRDLGDKARPRTVFTGQSWASQVVLATGPQRIGADAPRVHDMLVKVWQYARVPAGLTEVSGDSDTAYLPGGATIDIPAGEVWSKWCADLGILVRNNRRAGSAIIGLYTRQLDAENWRSRFPEPITRRVCLSPAEWVQPVTNPGAVEWTYRAGANTITNTLRVGYGTVDRPTPATQLDTSHANRNTGNQERMAYALANKATAIGYRVDDVTIDLAALARSGVAADRRLLRQLLELEEGDPVTLAYDWPNEVAGVYYTTSITETITPDHWRIALSLEPTRNVTGHASPDPAGNTWDTRYPRRVSWDKEARTVTWNNV